MTMTLYDLCDQAKEQESHSLPNYEDSHQFYWSRDYVFLKQKHLPKNKIQDGWSFFISVPFDYIAQAWELAAPYLLNNNYGVLACGIMNLIRCEDNQYYPEQKQLVIYTFKTPSGELLMSPYKLEHLLKKIEHSFRVNRIPKSMTPEATYNLHGSRYITTRYDYIDGKYFSSKDAKALNSNQPENPLNMTNPYSHFDLSPINHSQFFVPASQSPSAKTTQNTKPSPDTSLGKL